MTKEEFLSKTMKKNMNVFKELFLYGKVFESAVKGGDCIGTDE